MSFAVDVIGLTQPNNDILKKIAMYYPEDVPGFGYFDLWIKRKTLKYCFQHCTIDELKNLAHPDAFTYLEYAAGQQRDIESAFQKISNISRA